MLFHNEVELNIVKQSVTNTHEYYFQAKKNEFLM